MTWVDEVRRLKVRTNADTPDDAAVAREFGAEGIGLCRTEHMFFDPERILAVREMILADDERGPPRGAGEDPADAARRLRGHLPRDGRPAGHHPPARPAAARVPAAHGRGDRGGGARRSAVPRRRRAPAQRGAGTSSTRCSATAAAASASPTRRSTRRRCARSSRPPATSAARACSVMPEIMIPHRRHRGGAEAACASSPSTRPRACSTSSGVARRLHGRHDDRAAARLRHRRRDRPARRLLLLRHQRPHADHLRHLPRRRGPLPAGLRRAGHLRGRPVRAARPGGRRRADAHRHRARAAAPRPTSRSASAASTAASPPRSSSATARASTTSALAPTACRSRASPPPRPPSASAWPSASRPTDRKRVLMVVWGRTSPGTECGDCGRGSEFRSYPQPLSPLIARLVPLQPPTST